MTLLDMCDKETMHKVEINNYLNLNHKFNNLFEKGKSSAMNIKVQLQQN